MESGDPSAWGAWAMPSAGPEAVTPPGAAATAPGSHTPFAAPPAPRANPDDARNRRVLATLIDLVVIGLGYAVAATIAPAGTDWRAVFTDGLPITVALAAATFAYFTILEGAFGQTLGKALCDVRVVDGRQAPAGYGRAAVRSLLRPIDHLLLGAVGAICVIATGPGKRQRVGDAAAGTYVVRASHTKLPRAQDGTIAMIGVALALLPLMLFAAPVAEAVVPISDDYEAEQAASRYLEAAVARDGLAACRELAPAHRRALVASETGAYVKATTPEQCAPYARIEMRTARARLKASSAGSQQLDASIWDGVAAVGRPNEPLVYLEQVDGNWRVDPLARSEKQFVTGCQASGAPSSSCGCVWEELRGFGIATEHQLSRLGADLASDGMPASVQQAIAACPPR